MKKKVAILQSNYIPWKGYFDIINSVDLFIFHDDLQYTRQDWRNRNKIRTPDGTTWLTIPCGSSEKRLICDVAISDNSWQQKHWRIIKEHYKKADYFGHYEERLEKIYLDRIWTNLSELNQHFIKFICNEFLSIDTVFEDSRKYGLKEKKGDRVLELLQKCQATDYLSGPSAKNYLEEREFVVSGIKLEWMDYSNYSEYPQLFDPFMKEVTILDMLFNVGPNYPEFMKSFKG